MADARPLGGRRRPLAPAPPVPPRPVRAGAAPRAGGEAEPAGPVRFALRREGERLLGLAPGVDRRHLRRLRSGAVEVDRRVDLHGMDLAGAEAALREALLAALAAGARCVLVVHGRGLHSPAGPVLKEALPAWLAAPPVGPRVLAFATAGRAAGGAGATYVLLRRSR